MLLSGLSRPIMSYLLICFIFKEFVNWKSKSNMYVVFVCEKNLCMMTYVLFITFFPKSLTTALLSYDLTVAANEIEKKA